MSTVRNVYNHVEMRKMYTINKIGQAEINMFSHFSSYFLQNDIKVYIFVLMTLSRFHLYNLFLATTNFEVSRQNVAAGVNFERTF